MHAERWTLNIELSKSRETRALSTLDDDAIEVGIHLLQVTAQEPRSAGCKKMNMSSSTSVIIGAVLEKDVENKFDHLLDLVWELGGMLTCLQKMEHTGVKPRC